MGREVVSEKQERTDGFGTDRYADRPMSYSAGSGLDATHAEQRLDIGRYPREGIFREAYAAPDQFKAATERYSKSPPHNDVPVVEGQALQDLLQSLNVAMSGRMFAGRDRDELQADIDGAREDALAIGGGLVGVGVAAKHLAATARNPRVALAAYFIAKVTELPLTVLLWYPSTFVLHYAYGFVRKALNANGNQDAIADSALHAQGVAEVMARAWGLWLGRRQVSGALRPKPRQTVVINPAVAE